MRLCLTCRHFSPAGAAFCGRCGRSFGGRLCKKGHVSPPGAQFCVHCGKAELTEPTRSVGFEWLSRLLAWACVLLGIRGLALHPLTVQQGISFAAAWVGARLSRLPLGAMERSLLCTLLCAARWCLVWMVLLYLIPGETGRKVRQGSVRLLRLVWHTVILLGQVMWRILRLLIRGLRLLVEGRPPKSAHRGGDK